MTSAPAPAPAPEPRQDSDYQNHPHRNRQRNESFPRAPHQARIPTVGTRTKPRPGAAMRKIRRTLRRPTMLTTRPKNKVTYLPDMPDKNTIRIIPIGGVEEVGRNMLIVDVNGDIFVMDAGFAFTSDDSAPGVDYTLPNTKFLEENKDRIRAVIITHGHLDHIGGIPFLLPRFGNPPIYTRALTATMIAKRQDEFPNVPKLEVNIVEPGSEHTISNTKIAFFPVTHSIPDSMGVSIRTPQGNVVITGDLKLEHENTEPSERELATWGKIAKEDNILFIADSTNAEKDGFSIPENQVTKTLGDIIRTVKGRLIIGTFASQFERMLHIIKIAEECGKKIVTEGRSIRVNLEIAEKTGLLTIQKDTIIPAQEMENYPPNKILVLATGAQGEEFAALMRIATKRHKYIQFNERDTVVLSSSVIPGNEIAVQKLKDNLYRHKMAIINYRSSDVHSTGHGNSGELVWINKQVNAKFFMPGYGYYSMLYCHAKAVEQAGRPKDTIIIPDNGMVIDIIDKKISIHKEKVPADALVVDGFSIGDMQEVVVRDRKMLAKDGMFVIIATIQLKTGRLKKSPDIISRGFVYLRESQEMLNQARLLIRKTVEDSTRGMNPIDLGYVKNELTDALAGFLFVKTNKAPMVIPVLIGI